MILLNGILSGVPVKDYNSRTRTIKLVEIGAAIREELERSWRLASATFVAGMFSTTDKLVAIPLASEF